MLLIWLGDLLTEHGLGNGTSLIIFAGIIGQLPVSLFQTASTLDQSSITNAVVFAAMSLAVIYAVVKTSEAVRQVPIHSARRGAHQFSTAPSQSSRRYSHYLRRLFLLVPNFLTQAFSGSTNQALAAFLEISAPFSPPTVFGTTPSTSSSSSLLPTSIPPLSLTPKNCRRLEKSGNFIPRHPPRRFHG